MPIYTGIGSRETPDSILRAMTSIADLLATHGYTLRSGGADGADTAFEQGCDDARGAKEIYLPWDGFNGRKADGLMTFAGVTPEALDLAAQFHPNWERCSDGAQKLHARNGYQMLGRTLKEPSDFVICWTRGGYGQGGTGQAIRLARAYAVPVFDLGKALAMAELDDFLTARIKR